MKRLLGFLLALAALGGAFVWGFATERYRIFPMPLIHRAAVRFGLRWNNVPVLDSTSPALAALKNVPYLSGSVDPNPKAIGVLVNERGGVAPGLNFFSTLGRGDAFLRGQRRQAALALVAVAGALARRAETGHRLRVTRIVFPNGDVLAFVDGLGVVKLDKDSKLLWKHDALAHHDAFVADDGTIYALVHVKRAVPAISDRHPSLLDDVRGAVAGGRAAPGDLRLRRHPEPRRTRSSCRGPPGSSLDARTPMPVDVLHTNHVEVYDGRLAAPFAALSPRQPARCP